MMIRYSIIQVEKEVKQKLKEYCLKNDIVMSKFVKRIILEKITDQKNIKEGKG